MGHDVMAATAGRLCVESRQTRTLLGHWVVFSYVSCELSYDGDQESRKV